MLRKTEAYRKAIQMAKLLLLNYHPDIRSGRQDVLALMFDMNKLWERYVFKLLRRELQGVQGRKFDVREQLRTEFWKPDDGYMRIVKPDIVVSEWVNGELCPIVVLDTKWKHLTNIHADDADLKQMLVYNLYRKTKSSALVYPANEALTEVRGTLKMEGHGTCSLVFLPLVNSTEKGKQLDLKRLLNFVLLC